MSMWASTDVFCHLGECDCVAGSQQPVSQRRVQPWRVHGNKKAPCDDGDPLDGAGRQRHSHSSESNARPVGDVRDVDALATGVVLALELAQVAAESGESGALRVHEEGAKGC